MQEMKLKRKMKRLKKKKIKMQYNKMKTIMKKKSIFKYNKNI